MIDGYRAIGIIKAGLLYVNKHRVSFVLYTISLL